MVIQQKKNHVSDQMHTRMAGEREAYGIAEELAKFNGYQENTC